MSRVDSLDGICVVVPAAGLGARMEAVRPKQYIDVGGKSILEHTLTRILGLHPDKLVLVVAREDNLYKSIPVVDQCEIAVGGIERMDSVLSGLGKLDIDADDWVMVHDAVRPCVRTADILLLCSEVRDHEIGGLLGIPVTDTVKRVDGNLVVGTIDRSQLWLAQTPQLFRYGILMQALQAAPTGATDESSAVEALGHQPMMVQGHSDNIKVTTQADLSIATFYLSQGQRQ
ncbi:MAG: 2-C-methyl-D-erythritol 4-phosphate cytidylyltransferase [Gammaproteobacteria bacterium]|nr:2-C-methyl-D-erythritol 4-phosphate cytidylyltransferase [Gammaproteobacteria bacterium]